MLNSKKFKAGDILISSNNVLVFFLTFSRRTHVGIVDDSNEVWEVTPKKGARRTVDEFRDAYSTIEVLRKKEPFTTEQLQAFSAALIESEKSNTNYAYFKTMVSHVGFYAVFLLAPIACALIFYRLPLNSIDDLQRLCIEILYSAFFAVGLSFFLTKAIPDEKYDSINRWMQRSRFRWLRKLGEREELFLSEQICSTYIASILNPILGLSINTAKTLPSPLIRHLIKSGEYHEAEIVQIKKP